jgi:ferredoxin
MKYIQFIFSPTGGTKKAADLITSEWSPSTVTADLSDPACSFTKYELCADDLVLIAVPSFGGRIPDLAAKRLSKVRGNAAKCVLLCVYGNRAYEDTLVEMADIASDCGFTVIAAVSAIAEHSIMHQYASGRPDAEDSRQLKAFARQILQKVHSGETGNELKLPGNRPYKKAGGGGLIPKASASCTSCGLCARQCPAQAIALANPKLTDSKKCISCMRCVVNCPHSARKNNRAMVAAASQVLKKACSVRKECELFL